jgi:hypothetical protein
VTPREREQRWLLLLHQIPRTPGYLRVKIWRRLQRLGAVAVKNGVYALPRSEEHNEDLRWVMEEVVSGGGEATLVEATFINGLTDQEVEGLFNKARDAEYAELAKQIRALAQRLPRRGKVSTEKRHKLEGELKELRDAYVAVEAIDFFSSSGHETTRGLLEELERRVHALSRPAEESEPARPPRESYRGRTWVTRKGIFVDRIASAWLIRRFIDPQAKLKFVNGKGYQPAPGELRFDMFDAEFTHVGDNCTFEVLLERMGLDEPALKAIGEVVHDIDLKDEKFGRPQTAGLETLLAGVALRAKDDEERLARGSVLLDDLYEVFRRRKR